MAKKANFFRLLGTTNFLTFFVYLWCLMYIPIAIKMMPVFKYFGQEPPPIALSQTIGEARRLTADYTYEARNEEGEMTEITVPRGTLVYPLFRASATSRSIYVADQRGNIFLLHNVSKNFDVRNERVRFYLKRERKDTEPSISMRSEKNLQDKARYNSDNKVMQSDIEGKDVRISHTKTVGAHTYTGFTADGKFLGYLSQDWRYYLLFIDELPARDDRDNPIPFTHGDLDEFAVGRTMNEFFHRYRYPQSVYSRGGKTFAYLSDLFSQRKEEGGRWSDLILIADTDPDDAGNSIITGYRYTTPIGRKNFLDYTPWGARLLDKSSSLRKFIRGVEQQTPDGVGVFSFSLTDWGKEVIQRILPNSWHDGFINKTLNFIFNLFSLFLLFLTGVPILIIPYMIFVAATIRISSFSNDTINGVGALIGMAVLLPVLFLFAITQDAFAGYFAIFITFVLGGYALNVIAESLDWNRCDTCISWKTYEFTKYLREGPPMKHTTTRTTRTITRRSDGTSSTDYDTHSTTEYYRDVTKEYTCNECGETRQKGDREYLSRQRAEELAGR